MSDYVSVLTYAVYWLQMRRFARMLILWIVYRLEAQKCKYLMMPCANIGALLRLCRFLSSAEVSAALRPFYFSVHPDLFGRYPAERVSYNCEQEQSWVSQIFYWELCAAFGRPVFDIRNVSGVQMLVITCIYFFSQPSFFMQENRLLRSLYYLFMCSAFSIWSSFQFTKCGMNIPSETVTTTY